jgi:4-phospho-D-threonate 3-dehydrogenase / 4-phospho-D-erythronate 3-dehydrogenase
VAESYTENWIIVKSNASSTTTIPRIGLTMGDPAGVGPELLLAALNSQALRQVCRLVIFGHWQTLLRCADRLSVDLPKIQVVPLTEYQRANVESAQPSVNPTTEITPVFVDVSSACPQEYPVAHVSADCGAAAFRFIQASIDAALAGQVDAVTTAPINKESLHAAGHCYPGHTEIFAERAGSTRWCMMQYSSRITCTFVTVHCGYREVPNLLTTQRILETIELTQQALLKIRQRQPKLVVCGLNPHAGEHGLFGDREEERLIEPAIALARQQGILVDGPVPPDTAFLPDKLANCDAVVCMYHDQGHIPVKALAFDSAVNTTLGLSILRTSVDHGTAFDIAWQGKAKPDSLFAALRLAAKLA